MVWVIADVANYVTEIALVDMAVFVPFSLSVCLSPESFYGLSVTEFFQIFLENHSLNCFF